MVFMTSCRNIVIVNLIFQEKKKKIMGLPAYVTPRPCAFFNMTSGKQESNLNLNLKKIFCFFTYNYINSLQGNSEEVFY